MCPELLLCLRCGYYMLEYEPSIPYIRGYYEILGYGERWTPQHHIESFDEMEYTAGSFSRELWSEVWDRAWENQDTGENDEPYVFFDYLYFGM